MSLERMPLERRPRFHAAMVVSAYEWAEIALSEVLSRAREGSLDRVTDSASMRLGTLQVLMASARSRLRFEDERLKAKPKTKRKAT